PRRPPGHRPGDPNAGGGPMTVVRSRATTSLCVEPSAPRLIMDLGRVTGAYRAFTTAFPGVAVHYAMKCNPDPGLLAHFRDLGSRSAIASIAELRVLTALGVAPAGVLFSHPVKPWWHIRDAYAAGVRRFAADSDAEIAKLAQHAPGSSIHVRLA